MLSVLLPVINETNSLIKTVDYLLKIKEIKEILIIIDKEKTTKESKIISNELAVNSKIKIIAQTLPFLGGAIRNGFEKSSQKYTVLMASDLETDPKILPKMIKYIKDYDIVTVSRWRRKNSFKGYGIFKLLLNKIFQIMLQKMYKINLTDLTYGYRIFRSSLIKKINWEELKHPFLLETILKPIRLGCSIKEVDGLWRKRQEGYSSNTFLRNFLYCKTAFHVFVMSKKDILN